MTRIELPVVELDSSVGLANSLHQAFQVMTPPVGTIQTALWLTSLCVLGVITPLFFALSFTTLGGPPILIVAWIGNIMLALAQFWLLQKWLVRGWLFATSVFAFVGIVIAVVTAWISVAALPRSIRIYVGAPAIGAIFGGTLGLGQARILARHVRGSGYWIGLQAITYGAAIGASLSESHPWDWSVLVPGPLGGLCLRYLFRNTERPEEKE